MLNYAGDVNAEVLYSLLELATDDYIVCFNLPDDSACISAKMSQDFGFGKTHINNYRDLLLSKVHEQDIAHVKLFLAELSSGNQDGIDNRLSIEYQMKNAANRYIWVQLRALLYRDPISNQPKLIMGFLKDLEKSGKIDPVTGLYTQDKCQEYLEQVFAATPIEAGGLLLLDIDDFTNINTLVDRHFGDAVLRATVQKFQTLLPENAEFYRFYGDQFAILCIGATRKQLHDLYEKLRHYTKNTQEVNGISYSFNISGGISVFPENATNWKDLSKYASLAIKQAKDTGKNKCVAYENDMLREKLQEQHIVNVLTDSVHSAFKGFHLRYQPICDVASLEIKGAEALLRFQHSELGTINPDYFIPILENNRLIKEVGMWVIEQSIIVCKKWLEYIPDFQMHVNLSFAQLDDDTFYDKVQLLLSQYNFSPKYLTLELTESSISLNKDIDSILDRLKILGFNLAIDDFGTGYSSLGRLLQLNVDIVKIDKVLVQALDENKHNLNFIESVIRLCHNTNMKVCVEGVETRAEHRAVSLIYADYIQGFYVSKPICEDNFFTNFVQTPFDVQDLVSSKDKETVRQRMIEDKELIRLMMNATPLCLNLWNKDFENIECNLEAVNLFGLKNEHEYLERFFELSPAYQPDGMSSSEKALQKITEAFEQGRSTFRWMHCKLDGTPIPAEITLVRIKYHNDYIVAGYTRDMRYQLAAEEAAEKMNARFRALLDATPLCLNLWNKNFENIMCNRKAVELFNLSNEQEYLDKFFQLSPEFQPNGMLSKKMALSKITQAFKSGYCVFNWLHCNLAGEPIPTEITLVKIAALDESEGDIIAGYTRDLR